MATKGQKSLPVQGGFLLVKPDMEVYERLRDVVREVRFGACVGVGFRRRCTCPAELVAVAS